MTLMAKKKPKGWVKEPDRHSLAARGIPTTPLIVKHRGLGHPDKEGAIKNAKAIAELMGYEFTGQIKDLGWAGGKHKDEDWHMWESEMIVPVGWKVPVTEVTLEGLIAEVPGRFLILDPKTNKIVETSDPDEAKAI